MCGSGGRLRTRGYESAERSRIANAVRRLQGWGWLQKDGMNERRVHRQRGGEDD